MTRRFCAVGLAATALVLGFSLGDGWAGEGLVALQTADPSCPDDSGHLFVDCGNGTVTDNRSGLVWLANASCFGEWPWLDAMVLAAGLSDAPPGSTADDKDCGLSDNSSPGEWRLPSASEWEAMIADAVDLGCTSSGALDPPSITSDDGTFCWSQSCVDGARCSFTDVQVDVYWAASPGLASTRHIANLDFGIVTTTVGTTPHFAWPVRSGQ